MSGGATEDAPKGGEADRLGRNLGRVRARIEAAALRARRDPRDILLVAVTKYVDARIVKILYDLGHRDFGESTVQGLASKAAALGRLDGARWHLVGHLQRNKVAKALQLAESIHSLDSERLLDEIVSQAARRGLALPELWVEVNVSREPQKTGLDPEALRALLAAARRKLPPRADGTPGPEPASPASVAGLMTLAPYAEDPEAARPHFRKLRELRDACASEDLLPPGAGLSMGMSGDFEVAVEEGATAVRVGSAIFEGLVPGP
ncbi:MAG: YggS family pyridoxal phosphate-dependent enzyme [Planctomycetota bacterium]